MFNPNDPLFWVLIAFLAFVGLLIYYRVPTSVGKMLDDRADVIRKELDEARKLREDAQSLLADYQRKAREADAEAQTIIEQAKREAELLAVDARKALAESLERRSKIAEEKIARAEAQALSEVRATAVETALAAARELLKTRAGGATGDTLISQSIIRSQGQAQLTRAYSGNNKATLARGFFYASFICRRVASAISRNRMPCC